MSSARISVALGSKNMDLKSTQDDVGVDIGGVTSRVFIASPKKKGLVPSLYAFVEFAPSLGAFSFINRGSGPH